MDGVIVSAVMALYVAGWIMAGIIFYKVLDLLFD